jgi:NAD(P)-dependent dehydrogenase (short-subunit alcohol dehydrogenase family)
VACVVVQSEVIDIARRVVALVRDQQGIRERGAMRGRGGGGHGAAEAAALRDEGAQVVVTDVRRDDGEAVAARLDATFIAHDVADEAAWADVVEPMTTRYRRIDVLVNNAGIVQTTGLLDTDEALYRKIIDVNQIGVFLGMRAVAPAMIAQRSRATTAATPPDRSSSPTAA